LNAPLFDVCRLNVSLEHHVRLVRLLKLDGAAPLDGYWSLCIGCHGKARSVTVIDDCPFLVCVARVGVSVLQFDVSAGPVDPACMPAQRAPPQARRAHLPARRGGGGGGGGRDTILISFLGAGAPPSSPSRKTKNAAMAPSTTAPPRISGRGAFFFSGDVCMSGIDRATVTGASVWQGPPSPYRCGRSRPGRP
jgi:hypothetical protein